MSTGLLRAGAGSEVARAAGRYAGDWGGEFGRTVYSQGKLTDTNYGRDHPRCFTIVVAGGGIKAAWYWARRTSSVYNIVKDPYTAA